MAIINTTTDNSDKSFTVTTGKIWVPQTIYISYVSTSTAGNRQLEIDFKDNSSNVLYRCLAPAVQAASLTRTYAFALNAEALLSFRDTNYISSIIPIIYMQSGWVIRVFDNAAIAAAADDMSVYITYDETNS